MARPTARPGVTGRRRPRRPDRGGGRGRPARRRPAAFDPDLARRYGAAVGTEARSAGFTVLLGPSLDLARDPRGGRVAEALGEDPYLTGLLGAAHVRGAQVPADAFARWDGTARTPVDGRHRVDVTTSSDRQGTAVIVDVRDGAVVAASLDRTPGSSSSVRR